MIQNLRLLYLGKLLYSFFLHVRCKIPLYFDCCCTVTSLKYFSNLQCSTTKDLNVVFASVRRRGFNFISFMISPSLCNARGERSTGAHVSPAEGVPDPALGIMVSLWEIIPQSLSGILPGDKVCVDEDRSVFLKETAFNAEETIQKNRSRKQCDVWW